MNEVLKANLVPRNFTPAIDIVIIAITAAELKVV